jgi:hypothetical protein
MRRVSHHYVIAHLILRKIAQQHPLNFFGPMWSPQRDQFMRDVLEQVRIRYDNAGNPPFALADVVITTCLIKGFPSVVIQMPPPTNIGEAHFVAAVLKEDIQADSLPEPADVRYLTLEKGWNLDGTERTVLCAWMRDHMHVNYGDGPPATQEDFIAAVEEMI